MATSTIESRNGTRQPQAWNDASDIIRFTPSTTPRETNRPSVAVIWMKLV